MVRHMVFDATRLQHTRRRNDNTRLFAAVECFGLLHIGDIAQRIKTKWVGIEAQGVAHLLVERIRIAAENLSSIGR